MNILYEGKDKIAHISTNLSKDYDINIQRKIVQSKAKVQTDYSKAYDIIHILVKGDINIVLMLGFG